VVATCEEALEASEGLDPALAFGFLARGVSRRWIVREVENSLKRLAPTGSTLTKSTATSPMSISR
jgi:hypothetical protein